MGCAHFKSGLGTTIVCGPKIKACHFCGRLATKLCDFELSPGRTCDAPICGDCAQHFEPDKDFCPWHRAKEEQGSLPSFTVDER